VDAHWSQHDRQHKASERQPRVGDPLHEDLAIEEAEDDGADGEGGEGAEDVVGHPADP